MAKTKKSKGSNATSQTLHEINPALLHRNPEELIHHKLGHLLRFFVRIPQNLRSKAARRTRQVHLPFPSRALHLSLKPRLQKFHSRQKLRSTTVCKALSKQSLLQDRRLGLRFRASRSSIPMQSGADRFVRTLMASNLWMSKFAALTRC